MVEVVGVRFRTNGKIYFFAPNGIELEVGDAVIVETARGVEYGKVVLGKRKIEVHPDLLPPNDSILLP